MVFMERAAIYCEDHKETRNSAGSMQVFMLKLMVQKQRQYLKGTQL
jgi:hypothetical protein